MTLEHLVKNANCVECCYYYGRENNGIYFNCALHPSSPPAFSCTDWQDGSLSSFLLSLPFFNDPVVINWKRQLKLNMHFNRETYLYHTKRISIIEALIKIYPAKTQTLNNPKTRVLEVIKIFKTWSNKDFQKFHIFLVYYPHEGINKMFVMFMLGFLVLILTPFSILFFSFLVKRLYNLKVKNKFNLKQFQQLDKALFLMAIDVRLGA